MTDDEIMKGLKKILAFDDESFKHVKLGIRAIPNGIEVDFGQMYDAPGLNLTKLKALSEYFGTDDIDVDNYSNTGCDTCDWGSSYGHTIQILNPTKNKDIK